MPNLPFAPTVVRALSLRAVLVRRLGCAFVLLLSGGVAHAASLADDRQVAAVIQDYLQGSSYNRTGQLRRAFHPDARLYLSQGASGMREVGVEEYVGRFGNNPGQFNGRFGRLLGVQVEGNIASWL